MAGSYTPATYFAPSYFAPSYWGSSQRGVGGLKIAIRFGGLVLVNGGAATQDIFPGPLLVAQHGGLHIVEGGNIGTARWLWIRLTQPLWNWLDGNVGGNGEP